ncbi:MAG: sigma-70 family RNA polymerase sigma factor [Patescibacteria group bacterium]
MVDENTELAEKYYQTRLKKYRDELILSNLDLVRSIAYRFKGSDEPLEDLVQEGIIGLAKAIDRFNPTNGAKFNTYATHYIIGGIKHYLRDKVKIIRIPAWLQEKQAKIAKNKENIQSQLLDREVTTEDVIKAYPDEEDAIYQAEQVYRNICHPCSLNELMEDNGKSKIEFEELISMVALDIDTIGENDLVCEIIAELKPIYQTIINLLAQDCKKTEIAKYLHVSDNYIHHILQQLTKSAIRKALEKIIAVQAVRAKKGLPPSEFDSIFRLELLELLKT